jgi:alpha-mannosidase
VNPCSFSQQITQPASRSPSLPVSQSPSLPALGFAWFDPSEAAAPAAQKKWLGLVKPKAEPPLGEQNTLRNEFCEIHFDPHTGSIRSITDYHSRDPRLAQQIALRLPHGGDPAAEANYSIMAADELAVASPGPTLGEMVCRGRLLDREGRRLAGFRQTTRLWRGSRIIEISIELDIERQPDGNPWDSYYAARFAWKDETAMYRGVGLANVPTELKQIESPHFIDICRNKQHTTLLCGGLPYHRRFGHKLDTLLAVRGETARRFRLGIAIDPPHPVSAALGFLSPPLMLPDQPSPLSPTGWLFHLDSRNVVATHWETFFSRSDSDNNNSRGLTAPGDSAPRSGFRVRLLETDGRDVQLGLRCFRAVASARTVGGENSPSNLTVEGDCVFVPLQPHEWLDVEVSLA